MTSQAMDELMDRWLNEPAFRAALRADPEAAVRAAGLELNEAERTALRSMEWPLTDEELQSRVNKGG